MLQSFSKPCQGVKQGRARKAREWSRGRSGGGSGVDQGWIRGDQGAAAHNMGFPRIRDVWGKPRETSRPWPTAQSVRRGKLSLVKLKGENGGLQLAKPFLEFYARHGPPLHRAPPPLRSAPLRFAPCRSAALRSAPLRCAPRRARSAPLRPAPRLGAPPRSAPLRAAPLRPHAAPLHSAPLRGNLFRTFFFP